MLPLNVKFGHFVNFSYEYLDPVKLTELMRLCIWNIRV